MLTRGGNYAALLLLLLTSRAEPASTKPWLAWKWNKVVNAEATPNILDAPQDGFLHLSPSSKAYQPEWASEWAAALLNMPVGQRGFILRDFSTDIDPFNNPADGQSLWWDHGVAGAANKTSAIAAALKSAGVRHVDYVLLDFEGGMSKSYLDQLSDPVLAAMVKDTRYHSDLVVPQQNLRDTLTGRWPSPPVTHRTPSDIRHGNWDLDCYRWNDLSRARVAQFLTQGLADPLRKAFPGVEVSNYGSSRLAGALVPDVNGHPVCRYAVGNQTCGKNVGTHGAFSMYGAFGQVQSGWKNNPDPTKFPQTYNATAPNAFRWVVNRARAAALATPGGGLHIWVQPKELVIDHLPTPLACAALILNPNARCESGSYWEEAIIHVALSGVSAFGFWGTAGNDTAYTDLRLSRVLAELDAVVGGADRVPENVTVVDWMAPDALVVSSMALPGEGVVVHRAVCLQQGSEVAVLGVNGSVRLSCAGADPRVFPQSQVIELQSQVSPMGRWVRQRWPQ